MMSTPTLAIARTPNANVGFTLIGYFGHPLSDLAGGSMTVGEDLDHLSPLGTAIYGRILSCSETDVLWMSANEITVRPTAEADLTSLVRKVYRVLAEILEVDGLRLMADFGDLVDHSPPIELDPPRVVLLEEASAT